MKKQNESEAFTWAKLFPGQAWLAKPYVFLEFLQRDEADLLAFVLNRWMYYQSNPKMNSRYQGWYYFKTEEIVRRIKIPKGSQSRVLRKLKTLGIIKVEKRGCPPTRHIQIQLGRLTQLMEQHSIVMEEHGAYQSPEEIRKAEQEAYEQMFT